ncbi:MAG: O-antigen ligase family protein [Calditrichaeota bacterium]|nr:O-antigen ligase family protein [Calditrichota bacterium]
METIRLQNPFDVKRITIAIAVIELFYLLLLIKSTTLSILFMLLICGSFVLYVTPEFGFAIPFTINILLYYLFDQVEVSISMAAFKLYLLIFPLSIVFYHIKSERKKLFYADRFFWVAILIGVILIAGLPYSADKIYGAKKIIFYFIVNIPLLYAAYLLRGNERSIEKLIFSIFLIGMIITIFSFYSAMSNIFFKFVRFRLSENIGPLTIGRALGLSIITGIYFFSRYKQIVLKTFFGIITTLMIMPVIWSGSRGPTLGVLLSILLFFFLQPTQSKFRKILFSLLFALGGIYYLSHSSSQVSVRMATPIASEASAAFRILAWIQAIQQFIGSPFLGIGTGSFYFDTGIIPLVYPHNLILELACENGIPGLFIIVYFLYLATKQGFKNIRYYHHKNRRLALQLSITALTLFFFSVWNAMFSGDIYVNMIVWGPAGLIWALAKKNNGNSNSAGEPA